MPLQGPKDEDLRKLHSEVNQLVNQRLALTTLAVTVFTAAAAWAVPRVLSSNAENPVVNFLLSIVLLFFEFILFVLGHHLTSMLRIITVYLDLMEKSGWESDWAQYRTSYPEYWGYTKPQSLVFLFVGLLGGSLPGLSIFSVPISLCSIISHPTAIGLLWFASITFYVVFVIGMGFFGWFAKEDKIRARWRDLKNKQP